MPQPLTGSGSRKNLQIPPHSECVALTGFSRPRWVQETGRNIIDILFATLEKTEKKDTEKVTEPEFWTLQSGHYMQDMNDMASAIPQWGVLPPHLGTLTNTNHLSEGHSPHLPRFDDFDVDSTWHCCSQVTLNSAQETAKRGKASTAKMRRSKPWPQHQSSHIHATSASPKHEFCSKRCQFSLFIDWI